MQSYNQHFARVYNSKFSDFAIKVAPIIERFYGHTEIGSNNREVLDLCCGTGQLANYFASKGYHVTGVDSSEHMLKYAFHNNREYIRFQKIRLFQGNIAELELLEFQPHCETIETDQGELETSIHSIPFVSKTIPLLALPESFGLVVSTYDSLNHLENEELLERCFMLVYQVLQSGGYFIFDLNTRKSLLNWNYKDPIIIEDSEDLFMAYQGEHGDNDNAALIRIFGFFRTNNELYRRFEQIIINSIFELERIKALLLKIGWTEVYYARTGDLEIPIQDPEAIDVENGVCVVARK